MGFEPGISKSGRAPVHRRHGAGVLEHFEEIGVDLVRLPPGLTVPAARRAYLGERSVRFAHANYLRFASGVAPNDPEFGNQWAHQNTTQFGGVADADIDSSELAATPDAWQVSTGVTDTVVAVIDTGIDIGHPDLQPNTWVNTGEIPGNALDDDANGFIDDVNGWDFAHSDNSVYDPAEKCGSQANDDHGTHVAGILGAVGNNAIGVAGVNWRVRIMPVKFLAKAGAECGVGSDADAIGAIIYATRMGARVINASWGGPADPGAGPPDALRQALIAAGEGGLLFAAAAGNSGTDLSTCAAQPATCRYPPNFDLENEIVVAASTPGDELAVFSNFGGPTDLAAPGQTIRSTITRATDSVNPYRYFSATSMSTPFVTGALALLRSQYPGAPPSELKARVLETVDLKPAFASPKTRSGGRLNLNNAIRQPRPVVPTLLAPNGGEIFAPGSSATIGWDTNIPPENSATFYRMEFTENALASKSVSTGFESGIPPEFDQPSDSDPPWTPVSTPPHPAGSGTFSARSGPVTNQQASWLSTTHASSCRARSPFGTGSAPRTVRGRPTSSRVATISASSSTVHRCWAGRAAASRGRSPGRRSPSSFQPELTRSRGPTRRTSSVLG